MNDTIYRQDAIEAVDIKNLNRGIVDALQNILSELPSAQPEVTEKQVKEYCKKRALVVISSDLYHVLTAPYPALMAALEKEV